MRTIGKLKCRSDHRRRVSVFFHWFGGSLAVVLILVCFAMLLTPWMRELGGRSWKEQSSRAKCILNIRKAQQAMRSYQHANGFEFGGPGLDKSDFVGKGLFLETESSCPSRGELHVAARRFSAEGRAHLAQLTRWPRANQSPRLVTAPDPREDRIPTLGEMGRRDYENALTKSREAGKMPSW